MVLTITATDGGSPSLSSPATVTVHVQDINDEPCRVTRIWTSPHLRMRLQGSAGTLSAVDEDLQNPGSSDFMFWNLTGAPRDASNNEIPGLFWVTQRLAIYIYAALGLSNGCVDLEYYPAPET